MSATFCSKVRVSGTYGDGRGGHGLALRVKPMANGRLSKNWVQRLRLHGRPINAGLGSYPVVTLAEARQKALENRRAAARGEDPRSGGVPTFREACGRVVRLRAKGWKKDSRLAQMWMNTLRTYTFPRLGATPVSEITSADILACLSSKPSQARRVLQRISVVLRWSIAAGYRTDNPAADGIVEALPRHNGRTRHHEALHHSQVADALRIVHESEALPASKLALQFLALTACRTIEVRGAAWKEVDLECAIWTVPMGRSKTKREHRVPLSPQALDVLMEAGRWNRDDRGLIFRAQNGGELASTTLRHMIRRLGIPGTPHGMRTAFRSWCVESGISREIAERALAHVVGGTEGAYQRSDLLEQRRDVMQAGRTTSLPPEGPS